jgi:acetyl-CoA synthetase
METPVKNKLAFIWEGDDGAIRRYTYGDVYRETCKMACALRNLKVGKGDTVGIYMPMSPQIVFSLLACLKIGAIPIPIFSGFGPAPVAARLRDAEAKVLITADGSFRRGRSSPSRRTRTRPWARSPASTTWWSTAGRGSTSPGTPPGTSGWTS